MPFIAWLLFGVGGLVTWGAVAGINPIDELRSILTDSPRPKRGTWLPLGPTQHPAIFEDDEVKLPGASSSATRERIVNVAKQQLGKPYIWAAAGPNAFDCSGLTKYCYKQGANIDLPHFSAAQALMGKAVRLGDARPGDIIAYYNPVHHVALYIGGNTMIEAPDVGIPVRQVAVPTSNISTVRDIIGDQ